MDMAEQPYDKAHLERERRELDAEVGRALGAFVCAPCEQEPSWMWEPPECGDLIPLPSWTSDLNLAIGLCYDYNVTAVVSPRRKAPRSTIAGNYIIVFARTAEEAAELLVRRWLKLLGTEVVREKERAPRPCGRCGGDGVVPFSRASEECVHVGEEPCPDCTPKGEPNDRTTES